MGTSKTRSLALLFFLLAAGFCAIALGAFTLYQDLHSQPQKPVLDHILAIVAILYGVIAVIYEWRLHVAFRAQEKDIKEIVLSVHTRYLDEWPKHLRDITALVSTLEADDDLWISVDHLGYGIFSSPEEYSRYFKALRDAQGRRGNIKILVLGEKLAIASLGKQFPQQDKSIEEMKRELKEFQAKYKEIVKTVPSNYAEFVEALLSVQNALCLELTNPVTETPIQISTVNSGMISIETAFHWLIRRSGKPRAMVFAYPKYYGVARGYGF